MSETNFLPSNQLFGNEGGDRTGRMEPTGVAALALRLVQPPLEDNHWCATCERMTIFHVVLECDAGRIGSCLGCGEVKIAAWTRTNGEAA
jgi:hypothetical protein